MTIMVIAKHHIHLKNILINNNDKALIMHAKLVKNKKFITKPPLNTT